MAKRRAKPKAKAARSAAIDLRKDWPAEWEALIKVFGSTQALADAIGTTTMTIGRWADKESTPTIPTQRQVNSLARAHGLKGPFPDA